MRWGDICIRSLVGVSAGRIPTTTARGFSYITYNHLSVTLSGLCLVAAKLIMIYLFRHILDKIEGVIIPDLSI